MHNLTTNVRRTFPYAVARYQFTRENALPKGKSSFPLQRDESRVTKHVNYAL